MCVSGIDTYYMVYGAFATVPILLVWICTVWVIVLHGAVITAYLPGLLSGGMRRRPGDGWQFQLALEILQQLQRVRGSEARVLTISQLARQLEIDVLALAPVLEALQPIDLTGQLNDSTELGEPRHVMLVDLDTTSVQPLLDLLLLPLDDSTRGFWQIGRWDAPRRREAL